MKIPLRFPLLLLLAAAGCRTCPLVACHTRKVHMHDGVTYRGQPLWKKQSPAVGEKIKLNSESNGGKKTNDHSKSLK